MPSSAKSTFCFADSRSVRAIGAPRSIRLKTGKSDVKANLRNALAAEFDRVIVVATSPAAATTCQSAVDDLADDVRLGVELLTWLDVG